MFWLLLTWGKLRPAGQEPLPSILGPYPAREWAELAKRNFEQTYQASVSARVVEGTKDGPDDTSQS